MTEWRGEEKAREKLRGYESGGIAARQDIVKYEQEKSHYLEEVRKPWSVAGVRDGETDLCFTTWKVHDHSQES